MRLLFLGAGAIGGYFGGRLAAAGVDTTFLVRPLRAAALASDGLVVLSPLGDLHLRPVVTLTQAGAGFDAVVLSCKAYDLGEAMSAIAPAVDGGAPVLPLLNGLRHLDALDARFGRERVLGGLCHAGVTLTGTGEIRHLNRLQHLAFGLRDPRQAGLCETLHTTLARGGFVPVLSPDITHDMWEKFILLASYAGMTCLMRAPVGAIVAANEGRALMLEMLAECAAVSASVGRPPRPQFLGETRAMLTERGSPGAASMLRDILRGAPTEHEHIIGDMLARARASGVATPLLRVANVHLQAYEAVRTQEMAAG
ncbi:MAG: ketopantoate reductase family protein [Janthinobacterium lividum]